MLYNTRIPYFANASIYFSAIRSLTWPVWLDSAGLARYDILTANPAVTLTTQGGQTHIHTQHSKHSTQAPPMSLVREQLGTLSAEHPDIPFCGGALGYWGYDLANFPRSSTACQPEMAIGIYDWAIVIDHQEHQARLLSELRFPETSALLPQILMRLDRPEPGPAPEFQLTSKLSSNFTRDSYLAACRKIQNYLAAGDCYQVNLAQSFIADAQGDTFAAYLKLREISPAPYSAFLDYPWGQVLSSSPECFLKVKNRKVETRPIKGTRPRGTTPAMDSQLIADLYTSSKDRAENLMITDLLRNDLGRCCKAGSIKVDKLFEVESYINVHHLVSTITGELAEGHDALSLLQACFPGGSITGAPKKRAMEIIEQLEPTPRGVYCGALGYIGWDGQMDINIAIRTLVRSGNKIRFSVGGGIVADSVPEAEYQETLDKAAGILKTLAQFQAT